MNRGRVPGRTRLPCDGARHPPNPHRTGRRRRRPSPDGAWTRPTSTPCSTSTSAGERSPPSETVSAAGQGPVPRGGPAPPRSGDVAAADAAAAESRALGVTRRPSSTRSRRRRRASKRPAAADPQRAPPRRARRRRRGGQPGRCASSGSTPTTSPTTSGSPTGRPVRPWASSTPNGRSRSPAPCSPCSAGRGPPSSRALCQLALDRNADAFEEIRPPSLVTHRDAHRHGPAAQVRRRRLRHRARRPVVHPHRRGAAHLDGGRRDPGRGELPMRLMAYSPCYRREAGSAGRDTRGMLRTHEFDKVEILAYATPDQAPGAARGAGRPGRGPRSRPSASPTGSSRSAPATWARATTARSTSRSTRRAATSGSRSPRSRGSPTTRPAGPTSATGPGRAGGKRTTSWCTPSTARPWPCPGCGPRSSRPTGNPDGTVAVPEVLRPYMRGIDGHRLRSASVAGCPAARGGLAGAVVGSAEAFEIVDWSPVPQRAVAPGRCDGPLSCVRGVATS